MQIHITDNLEAKLIPNIMFKYNLSKYNHLTLLVHLKIYCDTNDLT